LRELAALNKERIIPTKTKNNKLSSQQALARVEAEFIGRVQHGSLL